MNERRPLLAVLIDVALLGIVFGACAWIVWDSCSEACTCPHCLDKMRTQLRAAELRQHLADLVREQGAEMAPGCMAYREKYDTELCLNGACQRCRPEATDYALTLVKAELTRLEKG